MIQIGKKFSRVNCHKEPSMNFIGIENINDLISKYATLKHPGVIHTEEQESSLEDVGSQARDILSQMNSFNFEGLPEDSSIKNNSEYVADLKRQIQDHLDDPDDYYLGLLAYPGIHYDSSNFILRYSGSRNSFLVGKEIKRIEKLLLKVLRWQR